jgi:hypothetical protein
VLILILIIYIFAILLIWHEKRWSVFSPNERLGIYSETRLAFIAHLLRSGLFYISIVGLFFYLNIWWAIIAWIAGQTITTLFQKYYFRKRIAKLIQLKLEYARQEQREAKKHNVIISDKEILNVAEEAAYESLIAAFYNVNSLWEADPELKNKIKTKAEYLRNRDKLRH